jgi:Domain of unknown function (DUF4419)
MEALNPTIPIQKITFDLCEVERPDSVLKAKPYREAIEKRLSGPVEACSVRSEKMVSTGAHAFMAAVHAAFNDHRPFVLSPDHIWLLIGQGFAAHVRAHAEALRHLFVEHQGKQKLEVIRQDIRKGEPSPHWHEVVAEFSKLAQNHLTSDIYQLLTPQFSTTTPIEKTAFEIVLLDSVQEYFELWMSLCGIPAITLEGSPADWRLIQERTRKLGAFQLEWWTKLLDPILSELVQTAEGNINKSFWESFYKFRSESGGPFIDGWLVKFFPYIESVEDDGETIKRTYTINRYLDYTPTSDFDGFSTSDLSSGLSRVPFTWDCGDKTYDMEFAAGFMGITQDEHSKALRPEIGWAVQDVEDVKAFRDAQEPTPPGDFE